MPVPLSFNANYFTLRRLFRSFSLRWISLGSLRSRSRAATLGPSGGSKRMTHRRCGVEETLLAHNWPVRRVRGHAHLLRWRRLTLNKCLKMFRSMMVCPSSSNKSQIYTHEFWVMDDWVSSDDSPTVLIMKQRVCMP